MEVSAGEILRRRFGFSWFRGGQDEICKVLELKR